MSLAWEIGVTIHYYTTKNNSRTIDKHESNGGMLALHAFRTDGPKGLSDTRVEPRAKQNEGLALQIRKQDWAEEPEERVGSKLSLLS